MYTLYRGLETKKMSFILAKHIAIFFLIVRYFILSTISGPNAGIGRQDNLKIY